MSRVTKARKAEAVGLSEVIGIRPAARQLNVAESTLRRWRADPDMAQLRAETKDEVAGDMWAGFQLGIRRIVELLPNEKDLKAVAVATGVIYDKYALLTGGATARSEQRDITGTLSDAELHAAVLEADRLTRGGSSRTEDEAAEAGEG